MSIAEVFVALIAVFATVLIALTTVAMWRAPDALTRANLMGPTTGVAIPLILIAHLLNDWATVGFDPNNLVRAIFAIIGMLVVASVSSFYMGRAVYGVGVEDKQAAEEEQKANTAQ
ncbi:Na+/H+ antiporter subunit G [Corynebacterium canis]|uniref:Na+/H+ antiporter subunit G n=1 Tax=Corynebacterium canis TaxID=679663 RepID=A0A5C5UJZ5_9CORY|nr:Na+/H+ antiporter subunit G [Corynebacterium canis]TWT25685.1 Na+/H+ antiporter subunit G [Corynebacterium canis]WJY74006.1 putative monovalent cation/H+ antiporter subunit G [Corynebacterium canis]